MNGARITVRAWLMVVAACGLASACVRWFAPLLLYTVGGWALSLVAGFGLSRTLDWKVGCNGRRTLTAVCVLWVVPTSYSAWAFQRASSFASAFQGAAFPYPDRAINTFERWLDARRPPPPDCLKLHGEYPLLCFLLGLSVTASMAMLGFGLGPLFNRPVRAVGQSTGRGEGVKS